MASTGRPQDSDGGPNWLVVGRDDGGVSILHAKPGGGGETLRYDLRARRLTEGYQRITRQCDRPVGYSRRRLACPLKPRVSHLHFFSRR